jgi:hypothetical protein
MHKNKKKKKKKKNFKKMKKKTRFKYMKNKYKKDSLWWQLIASREVLEKSAIQKKNNK